MDSQTKTRTIQTERIGTTGIREKLRRLCEGLPVDPLPGPRKPNPNLAHAPKRSPKLTLRQEKLAVQNALRYFSTSLHDRLVGEFLQELRDYGHIYMYRLVPDMEMRAYPIELYPAKNQHAAAVMLMIMNNLDPEVAQFPEELITYGANGQVFSNWAQFWLTMHYLSIMTEEQTLAMYSGHPMGLFPSNHNSPRVIITNGMVIPNYSSTEDYDRMFALGVTMYGQMTAGSYCYIGSQGIVHGTTLTIMNAGRQYLGLNSLAGKVFVTAGLGGMSGAQAKASTICGCIGVIAEVDKVALMKRYEQGWLEEWTDDLDDLIKKIKIAKTDKRGTSIGYLGNVVSLWEKLRDHFEETKELLSELGSDQTSCHNPYGGGYYPVQLTYEKAKQVLSEDPELFKSLVQESLRRQIAAINVLADAGMFFWDYGNAFLLEAKRAKADVLDKVDETKFRYPSYVQDFMGDTFSLGFGPFRWVCTSADPDDLDRTDKIAEMVIQEILNEGVPSQSQWMYEANLQWIREAGKHHLVVGSQARIFYADQTGRIRMAKAFNDAVRNGEIGSPVVISRDHHDVSGTDSPFRETSNIYDGSAFTADMAVQNCIGDAVRGATWVAIHNGGGVGWGEVINGGFGLVLDGSKDAEERSALMLGWDVSNGVARRAWSGNQNAYETIRAAMERNSKLVVTLPATHVSNDVIEKAFDDS